MGESIVTDEEPSRVRALEQCGDRLDVMISVHDVWRFADL
jgi:hypothetical protein